MSTDALLGAMILRIAQETGIDQETVLEIIREHGRLAGTLAETVAENISVPAETVARVMGVVEKTVAASLESDFTS